MFMLEKRSTRKGLHEMSSEQQAPPETTVDGGVELPPLSDDTRHYGSWNDDNLQGIAVYRKMVIKEREDQILAALSEVKRLKKMLGEK